MIVVEYNHATILDVLQDWYVSLEMLVFKGKEGYGAFHFVSTTGILSLQGLVLGSFCDFVLQIKNNDTLARSTILCQFCEPSTDAHYIAIKQDDIKQGDARTLRTSFEFLDC